MLARGLRLGLAALRPAVGALGPLRPPPPLSVPQLAPQQPSRGLMRFRKRLGRGYSHRWAMMRNMVTSLIEHERIKTGLAKAKELRRLSDKLVTLAKRGDQWAYRRAGRIVKSREMITKLFTGACTRPRPRAPRRRARPALAHAHRVPSRPRRSLRRALRRPSGRVHPRLP